MQEPTTESCTIISKNLCIIEDNETYIKYYQQIPGTVYYISKYKGEADKKFKYTKQYKFAKRILDLAIFFF